MAYVLVVITIFSTTNGIATDTRFQEFASRAACEAARGGLEDWAGRLKGTMGRELHAACYAKG